MSLALINIFKKGGRLHHGQRHHQDGNLHRRASASEARHASLHAIHRAAIFPQHEADPLRTCHFPQRLPLKSAVGGHMDPSQWAYWKKKCGCSPQTPRCIARQSQSPTLPIRRSWPKPAATFSIFKSNSLACGRTNSARGFLTKLAEKSSSPSLTNSTSKRCTNSIWDTTASPSINFCRKSVHGS